MKRDPKIERVARAMAAADGFDPDAEYFGSPDEFGQRRADRNGFDIALSGKRWHAYSRSAVQLLAGMAAARKVADDDA